MSGLLFFLPLLTTTFASLNYSSACRHLRWTANRTHGARDCRIKVTETDWLSSNVPMDRFAEHIPKLSDLGVPLNESTICRWLNNTSVTCFTKFDISIRDWVSPHLLHFLRNIISFRNASCLDAGGIYNKALGVCLRNDSIKGGIQFSYLVTNAMDIAGLTLNCICLLTVIAVYLCLEELRTVPGKNLICLASIFLFSELLEIISLITSGKPDILCQALAILRHWSMLSVFFCMGAISVDLYLTFMKGCTNLEPRKRFPRYLLFSLLTPSIIVLICVFVEYGTSFHVGYGRVRNRCFVNGLLASTVAFLAPAILVIALNTICMVITIWNIRRKEKCYVTVLKRGTSKGRLTVRWPIMALKLSTILGIGWLFGLVAPFIGKPAFLYIHYVFINLFGVFLVVGFVANRRVFRLLREKFNKKRFHGLQLEEMCHGGN